MRTQVSLRLQSRARTRTQTRRSYATSPVVERLVLPLILLHLALGATLTTPGWAWHPRTTWILLAFTAATLGAYRLRPNPGLLLIAAGGLANAVSGVVFGAVPNYFVVGGYVAFNAADVVIVTGFVGVTLWAVRRLR